MTEQAPSLVSETLRTAQVLRVFVLTLTLNVLVALAKLGWGVYSGSLSMSADGFHSLLDATSNIVGMIGLKISAKPADHNHPYGHRKFEALSAMVISLFIFGTCLGIVSETVQRFLSGGFAANGPSVNWVSYAVMLGTLGVNLFVSRYERAEGKRLKNHLLMADAAHTQSDVYATVGVLLSLILSQLGFSWVDALIALVIAAIVFRAGYQVIMLHLGALVDEAVLDPAEVMSVVLAVSGVLGCHRIRSRGAADQVFMDFHIQVQPDIRLRQAHEISHCVEAAIKARYDGEISDYRVVDVVIHVEEEGDTDGELS